MIVCSCNVLTDHDVRSAMSATDELPRTAHQVYGCLGCRVECGRCVATIRKIMDITQEGCDRACDSRLPLGAAHAALKPDQTIATR
ncbi:MAG: (2Fe-2S)-binding protein [Pseudomonadota bacterium]